MSGLISREDGGRNLHSRNESYFQKDVFIFPCCQAQNVVAEEKWSLNATKVHLTKQSESIYYTLTTLYFQQNPMLLVLI